MIFRGFIMKKPLSAAFFLLFSLSLTFARDDLPPIEDREVPAAPIVSNLNAEVSGNSVTLTWTQAPDLAGDSAVLRSDKPITAANFGEAEKIATVPATQTTYTDSIEGGKTYYYAILSLDERGAYYDFFVPASNSLLVAVSADKGETVDQVARYSTFGAVTRDDSVIVSWEGGIRGKNVLIYRSTSPFIGLSSLVQAVLVAGFVDEGAPFIDYPVPGVPYHYAIIDEASVRSGTVSFADGLNTNASPVEVPARYLTFKKPLLASLRPMPLPWLNPDRSVQAEPRRFTPVTERNVDALAARAATGTTTAKAPFVFRSEREAVSGGEEFALKKIVEAGYGSKDWKGTIESLERFLAIRRGLDTTARTRFYIGEAAFFAGNADRALKEFLLARDRYYTQSNEWIQYVLESLLVKDGAKSL
jgi:hypothetical protein